MSRTGDSHERHHSANQPRQEGYTSQPQALHPHDVTLDLTTGPHVIPHFSGVMENEGKDFWFNNSMVIVICVGSVAILIGVVALVWKYVLKDESTRERCRIHRRSKSTPTKELYKHEHALGVYASVQADNSTSDFHYEFEGPESKNDVKFGNPCYSLGTNGGMDSQGHFPAHSSTPTTTGHKCENGKVVRDTEAIEKTAACLTSSLY